MGRLAEQIVDNANQAAVTQQALRNNRRVVRHRLDPDLESEGVEEANDTAVVVNKAKLPAVLTAVTATAAHELAPSAAHTAITLSPLDLPAEQFKAGLDRRKQNRQLLMDWLRTALVDGSDFGRIHVVGKSNCRFASMGRMKECLEPGHWSKPVLFKSGAEKITGMLGMTVHYPSLPAYEAAVLASVDIKTVLLRCELRDAQGRAVAEGVGARNLSQDYGDINKTLKMAEKSAHIDATLRLAGLSEVFTQDLEDRPVVDEKGAETVEEPEPEAPPVPRPTRGRPPKKAVTPIVQKKQAADPAETEEYEEFVNRDDVAAIRERIRSFGFTEQRVLAWLFKSTQGTVTKLEQLSIAQCVSLLKKLEQWSDAEKSLASNPNDKP